MIRAETVQRYGRRSGISATDIVHDELGPLSTEMRVDNVVK